MKRVKLIIAYDGTNYCGWQIQPNGLTIEEVLNKVITKVTGVETAVIGASRTDSGVHALGNVAVFDTESTIPGNRMCHALNQRLPEDIVIVESEEVPLDFHPRYCDTEKTYEYHIVNTRTPIPTKRLTNDFVSFPLDVEQMRVAASYLVGTHDFRSFCNVRTDVEDTVRTIYTLDIIEYMGISAGDTGDNMDKEIQDEEIQDKEILIRIRGNGFLYNMVRIIVGTLVRVGRGFYKPEQVKEILEAKCRTEAGVTAPPQGLFLVEIRYK